MTTASMEEASELFSFIAESTGKSGRTEDIKPIQRHWKTVGLKIFQLPACTEQYSG